MNSKNEIIHTYGENSNYLHFAIGKASLNLFDVLTEDLKIAVSTILKETRKDMQRIGYKDVHVKGELSEQMINLSALPIGTKRGEAEGLIALIFSEQSDRGVLPNAEPYHIDRVSSQRITDLEQELKDAQEQLRSSVSEQETVNEELQAANEELLTANEELQSSNEELQSVNEELYTVNAEYQQKLIELADMNDDIANFLATTLIGIMFVDNHLNIRRFTNYLSSEFGVMEHDVGRSLKFIAYNFVDVNLNDICNNVLKSLVPDEREVFSASQKAYFLRVAPYRTTENKILGLVITLVDLSEQKAEQKMLKNANVALTLAQQANNAKSDFLSRMSHEIRTPINAITGMSEIALKNTDNVEVMRDCVEKIARAVKYMNSIVSDILEMSKIEQSKIELEYIPFSMNTVVANLQTMIIPSAKEADLSFEIIGAKNCSPIYFGDETRLQQILVNFLNNSIKYTPAGGFINLSIAELENVKGKARLQFTVTDNGIGIEKDFIPDLFKPFSREQRDSTGATSSIGLGLSIADNLVNLMHGYVDVESEVGKGSTFTIYVTLDTLNSNDDITILKGGREVNQDYDIKGLQVLIAEDNKMNSDILESILEDQGITCTLAADGEEAVAAYLAAESEFFDCILMDIRMPRMDGREATKMIRASGRKDAQTIPIIGVSADAFLEDIHKSRNAGLDDYITKPIDSNALFKTLEKLTKARKNTAKDDDEAEEENGEKPAKKTSARSKKN